MKHILIFFFLITAASVQAQQDFNVRKKHFNIDASCLALSGYDPVSYFEGKPQKGNAQFLVFQKGVKYMFSSQAHVDAFKQNPVKYEPAYGGWCAYAMGAKGEKVEIDPESYKITNGVLYLFYYSIINKTLDKWNADEANLKSLADKNWNEVIKK